MWRSLVARMHGVHEAAGSNPVIPTSALNLNKITGFEAVIFFLPDPVLLKKTISENIHLVVFFIMVFNEHLIETLTFRAPVFKS